MLVWASSKVRLKSGCRVSVAGCMRIWGTSCHREAKIHYHDRAHDNVLLAAYERAKSPIIVQKSVIHF
jgi:hypothetical protein